MKTNYTKSLIMVLLLGVSFVSRSQIISTFAGNGYGAPSSGGFSGDGGQATDAELYSPTSMIVDTSENVYIADEANNRIRKVNTSGIISTIAGNGVYGYSGDGGQATAAEFHGLNDIALDASGNIYIADLNRIRIINTSGIISTFAGNGNGNYSGDGGQATAAELWAPYGEAVDVFGNVYITDCYNQRVRKVNTSGIISTFAGNGYSPMSSFGSYSGDGGLATSAELNCPAGLALDDSGNIYIVDFYNSRIRKVNTSGIINTFAGNGDHGYSGDGGQATTAEIASNGVALDIFGNVYIADAGNARIRIINTSGIINTFAGNGTQGFFGNGGPATSAELNEPVGLAVAASGNVYIADINNNRVRKVTSPFTGINQLSSASNEVTIYPIPTTGSFTISGLTPGQVIELYDYTGQKVSTQLKMDNGQWIINISDRANGIYLVRILNKDGSVSMIKKMMKTY